MGIFGIKGYYFRQLDFQKGIERIIMVMTEACLEREALVISDSRKSFSGVVVI